MKDMVIQEMDKILEEEGLLYGNLTNQELGRVFGLAEERVQERILRDL